MSKQNPNTQTTFERALEKGNRFFARKNFPLAKKEFETALAIESREELLDKIRICAEQIAIQEGKEAIKRGRKLEKKGKYREALQHFEKAAAQETEAWLEQKIAELREKLTFSEVASTITGVEATNDLEARLAAYDKALAIKPNGDLVEKKAECLVRLERFAEATELYRTQPPVNDPARYYFGYGCVKSGHYLKALEQWTAIERKNQEVLGQIEVLLPFAARQLATDKQGYGNTYRSLQGLPEEAKSTALRHYEHLFKFRYIDELWSREEYEEILEILSPLPENLSLPLLDLYAKLYFKLAQRDIQHLEPAISFWLTAIYNDHLLGSLALKQQMGEDFAIQPIREKLLWYLEELLAKYAREGSLTDRLRAFFEMEARIIREVSERPVSDCPLETFPCTPSFAAKFSLSNRVFEILETNRQLAGGEAEAFFEASAYFSTAGPSLILLELGEEDKALTLAPRDAQSELATYSRWRVLLGYGMAKLRKGEQRLKRYFSEALPLLKRYPHYVEEIIELAYREEKGRSYAGLAEVMEFLSEHIDTPKLHEATAHAMGVKALELLENRASLEIVEKLMQKALTIFPEAQLAQTTLAEVKSRKGLQELSLAFKRQSIAKAVKIVTHSRDPDQIEYFFDTMEQWLEQVRGWDEKLRLGELREFYDGCCRVDKMHPVTLEIGAELRALERK
jgi:tetratricopeptide (TPR) repeat protein